MFIKDWTMSSDFINYSTLHSQHILGGPMYSLKGINVHTLPITITK